MAISSANNSSGSSGGGGDNKINTNHPVDTKKYDDDDEASFSFSATTTNTENNNNTHPSAKKDTAEDDDEASSFSSTDDGKGAPSSSRSSSSSTKTTSKMKMRLSKWITLSNNAADKKKKDEDDDEALPSAKTTSKMKMRLSKWISLSNAAISRREAERHIRNGDVTLFGRIVQNPAELVDIDVDKEEELHVKICGKRIFGDGPTTTNNNTSTTPRNNKVIVWMIHKLTGELVTENDPIGRPTIFSRLRGLNSSSKSKSKKKKNKKVHWKSIGRLDMKSEGLLLLTNDGQYARDMEMSNLHRIYRVKVNGRLAKYKLEQIQNGINVENGIYYKPMKVIVEKRNKRQQFDSNNHWLTITCTEGKNRQIRNVLKHLGFKVSRLIRIAYGDYQLLDLPKGMARQVAVRHINRQQRIGRVLFPMKEKKNKHDRNVKDEQHDKASPIRWVRHL